ncbi:TadE/TadG family type IV pilus assembly protein [Vreelandella zhanjiangensis]|uniref:TadE/TadG family type IV pilus assembly protein n=1 Tax=Vreelandella zhanjiangensis TaxID=1121960 RepID=UPI00036EB644|nr:TadE family protein [Halomonas zhanjiangensis]
MFSKQRQRGAVAIEFAAIFMLFFTLVYGIIAFSIPVVVRMGFQHYSAEAARAAVRVDTSVNTTQFAQLVSQQVTNQVTAGWLPAKWRDSCPAPSDGTTWAALPSHNGQPSYGYWQTEANARPGRTPRYRLYVCLQTHDSIVPQIVLGDIELPPLPKENGRSVIRGYTMTTF